MLRVLQRAAVIQIGGDTGLPVARNVWQLIAVSMPRLRRAGGNVEAGQPASPTVAVR